MIEAMLYFVAIILIVNFLKKLYDDGKDINDYFGF